MKRRPVVNYVSLWNGRCGLSTDTRAEIMRREGTANVRGVRPATQADVEWVRGMGGYVPEGRIAGSQA